MFSVKKNKILKKETNNVNFIQSFMKKKFLHNLTNSRYKFKIFFSESFLFVLIASLGKENSDGSNFAPLSAPITQPIIILSVNLIFWSFHEGISVIWGSALSESEKVNTHPSEIRSHEEKKTV